VSVTYTLGANTASVRVGTNGNVATTFYVDGIQLEQKGYATPYVETNGSTATRNGSRVQGPAADLNASQGWVSFRFRAGQAGNDSLTHSLFEWGDNLNNRIV